MNHVRFIFLPAATRKVHLPGSSNYICNRERISVKDDTAASVVRRNECFQASPGTQRQLRMLIFLHSYMQQSFRNKKKTVFEQLLHFLQSTVLILYHARNSWHSDNADRHNLTRHLGLPKVQLSTGGSSTAVSHVSRTRYQTSVLVYYHLQLM